MTAYLVEALAQRAAILFSQQLLQLVADVLWVVIRVLVALVALVQVEVAQVVVPQRPVVLVTKEVFLL